MFSKNKNFRKNEIIHEPSRLEREYERPIFDLNFNFQHLNSDFLPETFFLFFFLTQLSQSVIMTRRADWPKSDVEAPKNGCFSKMAKRKKELFFWNWNLEPVNSKWHFVKMVT